MESIGNTFEDLAQSFARVQSKLHNLVAYNKNEFTGSAYVSLPEWLDLIRPACAEEGIVFVQEPTVEEGQIKVYMTILKGGNSIHFRPLSVPVSEKKDQLNAIQKIAAATTYARRYQLMSIFGVFGVGESAESDGNNAAPSEGQPPESVINGVSFDATLEVVKAMAKDGVLGSGEKPIVDSIPTWDKDNYLPRLHRVLDIAARNTKRSKEEVFGEYHSAAVTRVIDSLGGR